MLPRVQDAVDTIAAERSRFERFCRSLSADELQRPVPDSSWQVKDFISHLATIDGPIAAWFGSLGSGSDGPGFSGDSGEAWDVDRYNDHEVEQRRDRGVDQILDEAALEREMLVAVMARLTDEQLDNTIHFGGDSKRPPTDLQFSRYLQGWALHDALHVADMIKALPERRSDPVLTAWLEEPRVKAMIGYYQAAMA